MSGVFRVVLTGGGTGGHVFPALAVAGRIREVLPDAEVLFVGTDRGLEARAVPAAGFPIEFVPARGMSSHPVRAVRAILDNLRGAAKAVRLLRRFRPDVVVGSGGYVSLPVCMAARLLGTPTVLLEQNVAPGKTTKLFSSTAARVCVSFDATVSRLHKPDRVVVTGNPVRREIFDRSRAEGRQRMGVDGEAFCILVTGASQGARTINEAVLKALPMWKDRPWHILHLTGRSEFDSVRSRASLVQAGALRWDGRDFLEDMASAYAAADLVIARAGAATLSELTCRGLPAVLIPYPHAGAHQVDNARWLVEKGGAVMVSDAEAVERVADLVADLVDDERHRKTMAAASLGAGHPDAAEAITREVLAVSMWQPTPDLEATDRPSAKS